MGPGRLVQIQNLPQNHLPDLDYARQLLRSGKYDDIEFLFDSIPDTLSQLIRTAFVPEGANTFMVADFSAIEARVIAWLAGEKWAMNAFKAGQDLYMATASQMFKVPIDSIKKGSPLRQKGKIATLACIAENQLVLTNQGLVKIQNITKDMLVWDGLNFVKHEGVIYKGIKEVINYEGLTATKDHLVWVRGPSRPVQFGNAASSGAHIIQSGNGGRAIRICENNKSREKMVKDLESLPSSNTMHKLWKNSMDRFRQSQRRKIERLSGVLSASKNSKMVRSTVNSCKAKVRKCKSSTVSELWGKGHRVQIQFNFRSRALDLRKCELCNANYGNGSHQYKWQLRAWKHSICDKNCKYGKQAIDSAAKLEPGRVALCKECCDKDAIIINDTRRNYNFSKYCSREKEKKLEINTSKVRVYDIQNAGINNRFTVSNCLVHNCGYGGGVGALASMDKNHSIPEEELPGLVKTWRAANTKITQFWWDCDAAAKKAIIERTTVSMQYGIKFIYKPGVLLIQLPSGRKLAYIRPGIADGKFGKPVITYEGMEQTSKQWVTLETYGPKIVENIVQAVARDCLGEAMIKVDAAGYKIAFHVHDELVIDAPKGFGSINEVNAIFGEPIAWAPGLLLKAEGYCCHYYQKD